jgi:predicted PurR-regulated permease PerM
VQIDKKTIRNIFLIAAGCIVLYWVLHEFERVKAVFGYIGSIVSPFVLGASLAFILNVPMRAIENMLVKVANKTLRRVLALVMTMLAVLLVISLVFWLLIPQLIETVQAMIPKLYTFAEESGQKIVVFIQSHPKLMELIDLKNFDPSRWVQTIATWLGSRVSDFVGGTFSAIGMVSTWLMDVVIAVVFAIYCLFQKETLARQGRKLLYAFLPESFCDGLIRILRLTNSTFSNFLSGQCLEVVILGCLFAVSMLIFRMPYAPLVSVLVAVTAFIPVVGAWAGCVLGAFFILVANPLQAVWFVVMFIVLQQIENNLIYPRVVGTSIGLSGMWVLVAVAVGGELMGVAGMFLMIPIASVLSVLLTEATNKRLEKLGVDPEKLKAHPPELTKPKRRTHKKK